MANLILPNSFINNTAIIAAETNANNAAIEAFVELIAAGTNIDAAAISYSHLAAATITSLTTTIVAAADDDADGVIAGQVFG